LTHLCEVDRYILYPAIDGKRCAKYRIICVPTKRWFNPINGGMRWLDPDTISMPRTYAWMLGFDEHIPGNIDLERYAGCIQQNKYIGDKRIRSCICMMSFWVKDFSTEGCQDGVR
jgi:hypothetical protein